MVWGQEENDKTQVVVDLEKKVAYLENLLNAEGYDVFRMYDGTIWEEH